MRPNTGCVLRIVSFSCQTHSSDLLLLLVIHPFCLPNYKLPIYCPFPPSLVDSGSDSDRDERSASGSDSEREEETQLPIAEQTVKKKRQRSGFSRKSGGSSSSSRKKQKHRSKKHKRKLPQAEDDDTDQEARRKPLGTVYCNNQKLQRIENHPSMGRTKRTITNGDAQASKKAKNASKAAAKASDSDDEATDPEASASQKSAVAAQKVINKLQKDHQRCKDHPKGHNECKKSSMEQEVLKVSKRWLFKKQKIVDAEVKV